MRRTGGLGVAATGLRVMVWLSARANPFRMTPPLGVWMTDPPLRSIVGEVAVMKLPFKRMEEALEQEAGKKRLPEFGSPSGVMEIPRAASVSSGPWLDSSSVLGFPSDSLWGWKRCSY